VQIKWLYLRNFRGFSEALLEFSPGINEIVGPNAQGKTTLLEALYLCMTASSFRTNTLRDLIRHDEDGFFVEVGFQKQEIEYKLQFSYDGDRRRIVLNDHVCESTQGIIGQLIGVICTPDVQSLVKGSPCHRRHFLDLCRSQFDPLYMHHLSRFNRALKQRNALLKAKNIGTIRVWEKELAQSGAYITKARSLLISSIQPFFCRYFQKLSGKIEKSINLEYLTKAHHQEDLVAYFEAEFERKRPQELILGSTLVGPHRDDLAFFIEKREASDFASEGEMRLAAVALKLAEWSYLKEEVELDPLLMVDDFGAFLDEERKSKLFLLMQNFGQVFLTAHLPQLQKEAEGGMSFQSTCFKIESGKLFAEGNLPK
jgi:DNA replication and repair protein RecF